MGVRIGIYVLPNRPWHELEERWRSVEDLRYHSLWDCDVLSWPGARQEPCFDGLMVLAGMAARTSRVRVGTLVLSLPIRNNPAVVTKQIVALDHLSGGRLEFGFGGGYVKSDHLGAGEELWDKRERVDRLFPWRREPGSRCNTTRQSRTASRGTDPFWAVALMPGQTVAFAPKRQSHRADQERPWKHRTLGGRIQ